MIDQPLYPAPPIALEDLRRVLEGRESGKHAIVSLKLYERADGKAAHGEEDSPRVTDVLVELDGSL